MRLSDLADRIDLPPTDVAAGAWAAGRRRRRRRRRLELSAVAVVVILTGFAVRTTTGPGTAEPARPADETAPTTADPGPAPRPVDAAATQRLLTPAFWAAVDEAPELDPRSATVLADDPVDAAVLATVDRDAPTLPLVLGDDGRWRRVDIPDLRPVDDGNGYLSPVVRPGSLSLDGTMLALPQSDGLVVVDLTDGSHRTYEMPGEFLGHVTWRDAGHVLVAAEGDPTGSIVDVVTGEVVATPLGPSTAFTDDDSLTWGAGDTTLDWGRRPDVPTAANNGGGLVERPPLVAGDVVVGHLAVDHRRSGSEDPPLGSGAVAVSATTGDVLAYLPTGTGPADLLLLGWQGGLPVLGLTAGTTTAIATWDHRSGVLQPLARASGLQALAWHGPWG